MQKVESEVRCRCTLTVETARKDPGRKGARGVFGGSEHTSGAQRQTGSGDSTYVPVYSGANAKESLRVSLFELLKKVLQCQ